MAGPSLRYQDLKTAVPELMASFTGLYEQTFRGLAQKSGTAMVGGTHWVRPGPGKPGFNTAHVFMPDGSILRQRKNHLFPGETDWGTATFDGLEVFDIAGAKVGIMTCYDSEFPEVARHFTLAGAQVLLCPSATYTARGFYRVRRCCAARAVENQLYVAECHLVGALSVPADRPFTSVGRSAVLGPIDEHTGAEDGVLIEAQDSDRETVISYKLDLELLERSRDDSEATILKDRRPDTYKSCYLNY